MNLMSQENIGVFTLDGYHEHKAWLLPTMQQSLDLQREQIKQDAFQTKLKIKWLEKHLKTQELVIHRLKAEFRTVDRRLAEIDGRLILCKTKTEFNHLGKPSKKPLLAHPSHNELKKALKKMSQSDRDELLNELLT